MITLQIDNLRALRSVRWTPRGTCALVGPNGSGKTTLFLSLKFLRTAYDRGLQAAVKLVFVDAASLRHRFADETEPVSFRVEIDDLEWSLEMTPRGPSIEAQTVERLSRGGTSVFTKSGHEPFSYGGSTFSADGRLGIRAIVDAPDPPPEVLRIAEALRSFHVYHDPDFWKLRHDGSRQDLDSHLHSRGINAFTMLHKWMSQKPDRARYEFVIEGLRAAFPGTFQDLDFLLGPRLFIRTYAPGSELPTPSYGEANGLLAMLVLLCNLAAAGRGSVVAIDEPENALHPFAVRELLRRAQRWARQHDLTVLFATHSTVLLDELSSDPTSVYVMRPGDPVMPVRLDQMKNPEWLRQFTYGELLASGELASNDDVRVSKTG